MISIDSTTHYHTATNIKNYKRNMKTLKAL